MSDMVNVPGVGPAKKGYVLVGVAAVVGIVGYSYVRRKNAAAAAAATAPPVDSTTAGQTSNPYSLASDASGYNTVYPSQQYGNTGYDLYGNPLPPNTGLHSGGPYTTNNDWATAAEAALQNTGITLEVASTAVTRVLGGLSVTSTQQGYFLQAVGTLGQPPQGYPSPIHVADPAPTPTPGGTPGTAVPNKPGNVHAIRIDRNGVSLGWSAVPHAHGYQVYLDSHLKTTVIGTSQYLYDLRPHTTHTLGVATLGDNGKLSPQATIHVTTKK